MAQRVNVALALAGRPRPEARATADGRTVACHRDPEWQSELPTDAAK
ncbi:hypothetical protein [Streptomyces sp. NPDC005799]